MIETPKTEPVVDPFSLALPSELPELTDKLLEAGMSRPSDILLPEEIHRLLSIPTSDQSDKDPEE